MAAKVPLKGKLTLTIHRGRDLANKQMIGKQDPYLVMVVGDEELKTKTHNGGGTEPEWEQSFIFNLTEDSQEDLTVHMKIWDKEVLLDRQIGRADIPVLEMIKNKGPQWYTFVDKDNFKKIAGYVSITSHFEGTGAPIPKTPTSDAPQMNYNENRPHTPPKQPQAQAQPQVQAQAQPPLAHQPSQFQQAPQGYVQPPQGYVPQQGYVQQQPPQQGYPAQQYIQQQPVYYVPQVAPSHAPPAYVPPPAQVPYPAAQTQHHAPAPARATGQSEWACKACTYWNKPSQKMRCEMCDTPFQS